jgi:hypothetical protein
MYPQILQRHRFTVTPHILYEDPTRRCPFRDIPVRTPGWLQAIAQNPQWEKKDITLWQHAEEWQSALSSIPASDLLFSS